MIDVQRRLRAALRGSNVDLEYPMNAQRDIDCVEPEGVWSARDLQARLCRALDRAILVLQHFGTDGFADPESPAYSFGPEKAIAETAMLAYGASGASESPEVATRLDAVIRKLEPLARSERVAAEVALHPSVALKFALPHVLLTTLGHRDDRLDDYLLACVNAEVANGHDRTSAAEAERAWLRSRWSDVAAEPTGRRSRSRLLDGPMDVFGGLREDAYALTHIVFYVTDFGFAAPTRLRRRADLLATIEALVARYLDLEDYDLAGELLLAWPFLHAPWSPASAFAFRVLARVEDEAGLLPCGNVDQARLGRLEGEARIRYALGMSYHTAYIMGLLCAAALRPGRTPPRRMAGVPGDVIVLDEVRPYLVDDQGHWQTDFSQLSPVEQAALAPFVLSVALAQRSRARDYRGLSELLGVAERHGLMRLPACRQAAQLLERLANCAVALQARRAPKAAGTHVASTGSTHTRSGL